MTDIFILTKKTFKISSLTSSPLAFNSFNFSCKSLIFSASALRQKNNHTQP